MWNAILPFSGPNDITAGVTTGHSFYDLRNTLNLALVQIPGVLLALDGTTGTQQWQWPIPAQSSIEIISGWNDTIAMLLQGAPVQSPYFPVAVSPTTVMALDAANGQPRWSFNGTTLLPQTQAEASTYSVESIVAGQGYVVYARGNQIVALNADDGTVMWRTLVALEGSVGTGQGANITNVIFIPSQDGEEEDPVMSAPGLLLNANNWGFQRFVYMQLNTTNTSGERNHVFMRRWGVSSACKEFDHGSENDLLFRICSQSIYRALAFSYCSPCHPAVALNDPRDRSRCP